MFVHSRRDPEEFVTAVDLDSGKVVWQQKYPAPFAKNQYAVRMAKGPNSTPLVVGDASTRLESRVCCRRGTSPTAPLAWRKDFSGAVDTSKLFCGTAMSPLLEGGSLIVQVGSDVHGGRVIAIDPATGAERWTWRAGPGYASPIAITAAAAADRHADQPVHRRHRRQDWRRPLVAAISRRVAREHRRRRCGPART